MEKRGWTRENLFADFRFRKILVPGNGDFVYNGLWAFLDDEAQLAGLHRFAGNKGRFCLYSGIEISVLTIPPLNILNAFSYADIAPVSVAENDHILIKGQVPEVPVALEGDFIARSFLNLNGHVYYMRIAGIIHAVGKSGICKSFATVVF